MYLLYQYLIMPIIVLFYFVMNINVKVEQSLSVATYDFDEKVNAAKLTETFAEQMMRN